MLELGVDYVLSTEQSVECAKPGYTCSVGGWPTDVYNYVKTVGGLETEAEYPYVSYNGNVGVCEAKACKYVIGISGYTFVYGEAAMANYVLNTGPLSICLNADYFNTYKTGVLSVCGTDTSLTHCVQAVGIDTNPFNSYWIIRNQWGTGWGESGFIYIKYGSNLCNLDAYTTWTTTIKSKEIRCLPEPVGPPVVPPSGPPNGHHPTTPS